MCAVIAFLFGTSGVLGLELAPLNTSGTILNTLRQDSTSILLEKLCLGVFSFKCDQILGEKICRDIKESVFKIKDSKPLVSPVICVKWYIGLLLMDK